MNYPTGGRASKDLFVAPAVHGVGCKLVAKTFPLRRDALLRIGWGEGVPQTRDG